MRSIIALLFATACFGQITQVSTGASANAAGSGTATTASRNASTANSGLACVTVFGGDASTATVGSTSGSWTYVTGTKFTSSSGDSNGAIFQRTGSFSSSEVATATLGSDAPALSVSYWSGLGVVDVINGSSYPGTATYQAGSVTPSVNNELAFSCFNSYDTTISGLTVSGSTLLSTVLGNVSTLTIGSAATVQTTATAFNPTWTITTGSPNGGTGINASFKQVVAPTGSLTPAHSSTF